VIANGLRFAVHGTRGSFIKQGLDAQEDALKAGRTPGDAKWGVDARVGVLSQMHGDDQIERAVPGIPGDYRAFYAGVRDAIRSGAPNPVTGDQALAVMQLIERGLRSSELRREM
jgi:predicted dehydrogenase